VIGRWRAAVSIEIGRLMEYRWNFFFRTAVVSLIPLLVKIYLWATIFESIARVGAYTKDTMIAYQLWGAVFALFIEVRTTVDNVSTDIRMGRITRYLLMPVGMFEITTCQYVGSLLVQGLGALVGAAAVIGLSGHMPFHPGSANFWAALAMVGLASLFWYMVHYIVGLIAFWLEELWTFFVMFQIAARFLSGNPVPIDLFPAWFQSASVWLPFQWIFYAPVRLAMTPEPLPELWMGLPVLAGWCAVLYAAARFVWARGLRLYTAAGI
jgi:ABC-2 type transport system permease protein